MSLKAISTLFHLPHLRGQMQIMQDIKPFLRLHFLYSAIKSGLLAALRAPASKEELAQKLHAQRPELLERLLELGVSLRELSREKGLYKIRGKRSLALVGADNDPLAALVQEYVDYHGSAHRHLAARIAGDPLGSYLEKTGSLIARSSRTLEPFVKNFVQTVVKKDEPLRILEVGCGSGIYLRHAAEINPQITAVAIDMQEEVVKQARANLSEWGIRDRFKLMAADVRHPPEELAGPFDLITLYNNVYYFALEERPALFRRLRSWLAPYGALAMVSLMQGSSFTAVDFDLTLRSTVGCAPLPEIDDLTRQLKEGGFSHVKKVRLMPWEHFYGVVAT